jgi:hypothetical protein
MWFGIEILNIYPAQDLFEWFDDCGRKKKWIGLRNIYISLQEAHLESFISP